MKEIDINLDCLEISIGSGTGHSNFATKDYVDKKIANIKFPDLENYATKEYIDGIVGDINTILEIIINE